MINRENTAQPPSGKKSPVLIITVVVLVGLAISAGAFIWLHSWGSKPPPSPSRITPYTFWKEPTEQAFTVLLPKDWTATGGIDRSYVVADFSFEARDPTNSIGVFFRLHNSPSLENTDPQCPWIRSNNPALDPTCVQGSVWTPTDLGAPSTYQITIQPYLASVDYIKLILLPSLQKSYPDIQLISSHVRHELDSQFLDLLAGQSDGGDALFSYTYNGRLYNAGFVVVTSKMTVGYYTYWWADFSGAFAPQQDFSTVTSFYSTILPTTTVSVPWLKQEIPSQQAKFHLIAETSSQITQNDMRLFNQIVETQSKSNEAWGNSFGLTQDVRDPFDNTIRNVSVLQIGYCWWKNAYGGDSIVSAKCDEPPGVDYTQMQRVYCDQGLENCRPNP